MSEWREDSAGNWPRAALMAACTSRAAASMSRFRSNCSVSAVRAERAGGGHFRDAGDARELLFERRRDRRRHGLGTRARAGWRYGDGRKIHLGSGETGKRR